MVASIAASRAVRATEMFDDNRLVCRVCAVTHCAHPVECGHPKGSGKVAVGAAAGRRLLKGKAKFRCEYLRLFEERNRSRFAFHWGTVDTTGDREFAVGI